MSTFLPDEGGWPYPDEVDEGEQGDAYDPYDDDVVSLHAFEPHIFDDLEPLEQTVVAARFGINGAPERSMKELHAELGVPKEELKRALGAGLAKIRSHLAD